ncbi:hypothetical protein G5C51_28165 [Streptomyces sp. A7024]|uniref:Uncharacterized protein n=1 Tax=Streptomyces coryli TaxID=1128680 RepID=A0A6G4U6N3_9ACTN|nr:hypothetical protein [Streptomyces coryli]NGN67763.1 hypothetical protein [Streptomyces coryli]
MRPAHDHHSAPGTNQTPIYDALYAEYRRLFRALPGDRSGEEKLRFEAVMRGRPPLPHGGTRWVHGQTAGNQEGDGHRL